MVRWVLKNALRGAHFFCDKIIEKFREYSIDYSDQYIIYAETASDHFINVAALTSSRGIFSNRKIE
jgi:hypothetical protein